MNETAYERVTRALRGHGCKVTDKSGQRADATCPAHEDHAPSLAVTGIAGQTLVHCFAGCDYRDVLASIELTPADLYDEKAVTYRYDDGRTVRRYYEGGKKRFAQSDTAGTPTLYHRAQLEAAGEDRYVFLVEGEKDVHAIEAAGGVATTAPQGAPSFHKVDVSPLAGRLVVCVVDRDDPGDKWAAQVAAKLDGVAKAYKFVRAAAGKDAADHIAAGHDLNAFEDYALPPAEKPANPFQFLPGGSFVLDVPDVAPAVWGDGKDVVWAQGEALMICGPSGVGKTTIALQLLRARLGLQDKVLGHSVAQTGGRILYLVMDRPAQFQRAARRVFTEQERGLLDRQFVARKGPPPKDLAAFPELLVEMCIEAQADTVFIDSVKDAAVGISKDEVGAGYNRARQNALSEGIEVLELHHMRKSGADNKQPTTLDDIYGSTWLTAGAGSVVLLWGEAGDPVVAWRHLKQPEVEVGPFKVVHDHENGVSEVEAGADLIAAVSRSGVRGLTALEWAVLLFEVSKPTAAQKKRAQRALDRKVADGVLSCLEGSPGGDPSRYFLRRAAGS